MQSLIFIASRTINIIFPLPTITAIKGKRVRTELLLISDSVQKKKYRGKNMARSGEEKERRRKKDGGDLLALVETEAWRHARRAAATDKKYYF